MTVKARRALATAFVTVAAGLLPMVASAPAQASSVDCMQYLSDRGYIVGPKVRSVCNKGDWDQMPLCPGRFISMGINGNHAYTACGLINE